MGGKVYFNVSTHEGRVQNVWNCRFCISLIISQLLELNIAFLRFCNNEKVEISSSVSFPKRDNKKKLKVAYICNK